MGTGKDRNKNLRRRALLHSIPLQAGSQAKEATSPAAGLTATLMTGHTPILFRPPPLHSILTV